MVTLADDDTAPVDLGFSFPFFGKSYAKLFINSDGNLTFGTGDVSTADRSADRFLAGAPRIALIYRDLDPTKGGLISYRHDDASTLTVSYQGVPAWGTSGGNSASVTLQASGAIVVAVDGVSDSSLLVGVSKGGAGNYASASDLASLVGQSIHYGGTGAVYQDFGQAPFSLAGSKLTFLP